MTHAEDSALKMIEFWLNSGMKFWNETRGEGMQEKNSRQTWKEIESEMTRSVRKNR